MGSYIFLHFFKGNFIVSDLFKVCVEVLEGVCWLFNERLAKSERVVRVRNDGDRYKAASIMTIISTSC